MYAASEVKAIVEDEAASVSKESDNYWVLAAALKRYLDNEGNGQLPIEVYTFVVLQPPLCGGDRSTCCDVLHVEKWAASDRQTTANGHCGFVCILAHPLGKHIRHADLITECLMTSTLLSCKSAVKLEHEVMLLDAKADTEIHYPTLSKCMCSLQ